MAWVSSVLATSNQLANANFLMDVPDPDQQRNAPHGEVLGCVSSRASNHAQRRCGEPSAFAARSRVVRGSIALCAIEHPAMREVGVASGRGSYPRSIPPVA